MSDVHATAAAGFSGNAGTYVRGRPTFPPAALDWLRNDLGLRTGTSVVDVGAGTGKFTRLLIQTGAAVMAVEPLAAMREQLVRDLPHVTILPGVAQHIPLPDACMDAV